MTLSAKAYIYAMLAMLLITSIAVLWGITKPAQVIKVSSVEYRRALTPEPVEIINTVIKTVKVKVYEKAPLKETVPDLPVEMDAPAIEVLAVAPVECPDNAPGAMAVVALDTDTGETDVYFKPLAAVKRPFFDLMPSVVTTGPYEVGLRYGLSTRSGQIGSIYGRFVLARTGSLYWNVYGEITMEPEAVGMIELSYRPRPKRHPI
jgi:hypothetical protein